MRASRAPPNTIFAHLRVLERVSDVLRTSRGRKRYPARTAFTTFSDIRVPRVLNTTTRLASSGP